jgi:pyridoxamine 5'-phosphate oxidase family protein
MDQTLPGRAEDERGMLEGMLLTDAERAYLSSQILGRLATVSPDGTPQNNPVAFFYNPEDGTVDIGGNRMGSTRKFRNVQATGKAALVVDDIESISPWKVRGIEFRGRAEALVDQSPPRPGFSRELIRIHPGWIFAWGIEGEGYGTRPRTVGSSGE